MELVVVPPQTVVVTDVVPLTYYRGKFPTHPLSDDSHAGFTVAVTAHVWCVSVREGGNERVREVVSE